MKSKTKHLISVGLIISVPVILIAAVVYFAVTIGTTAYMFV